MPKELTRGYSEAIVTEVQEIPYTGAKLPPLTQKQKYVLKYLVPPIAFAILSFIPESREETVGGKLSLALRVFFFVFVVIVLTMLFTFIMKNMMFAGATSATAFVFLGIGIMLMNIVYIMLIATFVKHL
jgi:hypothetical protein